MKKSKETIQLKRYFLVILKDTFGEICVHEFESRHEAMEFRDAMIEEANIDQAMLGWGEGNLLYIFKELQSR